MSSVVMVTPFPPQDDGIAVHAADLVGALGQGVDVLVVTGAAGAEERPGVHGVLTAGPRSLWRLLRLLGERRPQIIHFQFNLASFGIAWVWAVGAGILARRRSGVRLVATLHEVRRDLARLGPGARVLYRLAGSSADALVVYTEEARDLLIGRCGVDPGRIALLAHGCRSSLEWPSAQDQAVVAARYGLADGAVLFLGYLHPDKGLEHLIDAAAILVRDDPALLRRTPVIVAGRVRPRQGVWRRFERRDRAYEAQLHGEVVRQGLEDVVRFVGAVDEADLAAVLHLSTVVVLPYLDVTQSGVANLCLAAATPVVASRLPGLFETLGGAAVYVEPGDAVGLAARLREVLLDGTRRRQLAELMAARRASRTYEATARELRRLYESLGEPAERARRRRSLLARRTGAACA